MPAQTSNQRKNANPILPVKVFNRRMDEIRDYIQELFPDDYVKDMNINRIVTVVNKHGFKDEHGRALTRDRLTRMTSSEVIRWLEELYINQTEANNFINSVQPEPAPKRLSKEERQMNYFMNTFQPEPVPQKLSKEERRNRYAIANAYLAQEKEQVKTLLENTEAEPVQQKLSHTERLENYQLTHIIAPLNKELEEVENRMDNVKMDLSKCVKLDDLVLRIPRETRKELTERINNRLIEWFENIAAKLTTDKPHLFVYKTLDVNGKDQWKNIYLTPYNLKTIIDELKENGFNDKRFGDKIDEIIANIYEDTEIVLPPLSVMKAFLICPFEARYGKIYSLETVKKNADSHKIKRKYTNRENAFFPYYASEKLPKYLLDYLEQRLQIINRKTDTKTVLKDCCAIFALRNAGVDEDILKVIKGTRLVNDRNIKFIDLINVCAEQELNVAIRDCNAETTGHKNQIKMATHCKDTSQIVLCAYKGHYFLEEATPFSLDNIRHIDKFFDNTTFVASLGKRFRSDKWITDNSRKNLMSYDLVRMLFDLGYFQEMSFQDMMKYPQVINTIPNDELKIKRNNQIFKSCFKSAKELGLDKHNVEDNEDDTEDTQSSRSEDCTDRAENNDSDINDTDRRTIWYADFETDTHKRGDIKKNLYTEPHEPFLVCLHNQDGTIQKEFEGVDCGKQLLNYLPNNSLVLFHNLKYDICFIAKYFVKIRKSITRGKCVMVWSGFYNGKYIELKDSASLITAPLAKFPKMFQLESGVKEVFPYEYYTISGYNENTGNIADASKYLKSDDDKKQFVKNIDEVVKCRIDAKHFDMKKYARFYCHQDVRILREGFNKFQKMILDDFNIDVFGVCSAATLAYKVFLKNVLLKEPGIKATSGFVDQYIRGALIGGRCMVRDNKAFHTNIPLVDFDARSLYPSAMNILDIPLGEAKGFIGNVPRTATYYICDILIHKIHNPRHFPLIRIDRKWCDTFTERTIRVDKRTLEDLDAFYDIDYDVKQGIYWNHGTTPVLKEFIQHLYNRRRELKEQGNPLQEVYKLILNSCYGKMIQKPYPTKKVVKNKDDAGDFLLKNANWILNQFDITDSDLTVFEQRKSIRWEYSFSLIGEMVLSHSKHIMNEVMCLAEDINIPIFYQDTDSMHLPKELLPLLCEKFHEKYDRELIGSALGQFHSDFTYKGKDSDNAWACESYFIGKKMYLDILTSDDGGEDLHIRLKGISNDAIKKLAVIELYKKLFETDEVMPFDLAEYKKFDMKKEFEIYTRDSFVRKIKCLEPLDQRYTLKTLEEAQELKYN